MFFHEHTMFITKLTVAVDAPIARDASVAALVITVPRAALIGDSPLPRFPRTFTRAILARAGRVARDGKRRFALGAN